MDMRKQAAEDLERILGFRHSNGGDFWATPDGKLGIEKPISTLTALLVMGELQVPGSHEALRGAAQLVLDACGPDGRVRIAPKGSVYPCHTALAAAALCRNGYAEDGRVQAMLDHLLAHRYEDGGWRCNKFSYGRGPETEHSNPGVTLFMQVEYPFLRYNLFQYVHVLSYYPKARKDRRFQEALAALAGKLDSQGRMVVERPSRKLADLWICRKGEPSEAATRRYREIVARMEGR
ncbi:prenyltransferase [Anaerotalea alkaliphila]|uniref:Prenyltransferase n=1 Tax=Anaerotalea alkaliphila TaxID=2662126 RepID=A0A7X5HVS0_9FIRM|nr:prenyltransferase [Anaerotalea alkaliphila]NDL67483.1 prenyltransferase [Anaerotalea alkaliphila]